MTTYEVNEKTTTNNTASYAQIIQDDQDVLGRVDTNQDIDWYKIKFDYDGRANFYLNPLQSNSDVDLRVYDIDTTTLLGQSLSLAGEPDLITINVLKNRYYYIRVNHIYNTGTPGSDAYHLRCKVYPYIDKDLGTVKYQQQDSRWGSLPLDCAGYTMATGGCYITSGAMVLGETPLTHYNYMNTNSITNCPYSCTTVSQQSYYDKTYENEGLRDSIDRFDSLKDDIFDYIYNKEVPVIARVNGTNGTHFIVIKGFEGEIESDSNGLVLDNVTKSMFKVNDPGYINNSTLADSLSNGYTKLTHIEVMY